MSKYDKFGEFMQNVINEANKECYRAYQCSITDLYRVSERTRDMIEIILKNGWWLLPCLVAILLLGKIGFLTALVAFCAAGAGLLIVGLLAGFGGIAAIRYLYKERVFPIAVKKTGDVFRDEFERHINDIEYIDKLTYRTVQDLISRARKDNNL